MFTFSGHGLFVVQIPSKHAGSNLEAFWLRPIVAITASVQPESAFLNPIQFRSSKEGPNHIVQNWPISSLDGWARFWPNMSVPEASWCARIIRAQFWQNATGPLPVSYFQTWLHSSTDGPDQIVQNQPRSDLVLVDRVRF